MLESNTAGNFTAFVDGYLKTATFECQHEFGPGWLKVIFPWGSFLYEEVKEDDRATAGSDQS
jgi:hypothetical protein